MNNIRSAMPTSFTTRGPVRVPGLTGHSLIATSGHATLIPAGRMLAPVPMTPGPHLDRLNEALAREAAGQRALLTGDEDAARPALAEAVAGYRASWELAPPGSYGRLIGALKAAVLAGDAAGVAAYAREQIPAATSPPSAYALAIAALVVGDDAQAAELARTMREGSDPFVRAADAIAALSAGDAAAYAAAVRAIVADFEGRDAHLTGVPIADTALMLERLAEARGIAAAPASPLLPADAGR
jgi:hypothetical protein